MGSKSRTYETLKKELEKLKSELTSLRNQNQWLSQQNEWFKHHEIADAPVYDILFHQNPCVMLIIDPQTGQIVDANCSAGKFYGYPVDKLKELNIQDINTLSPGRIKKELELSKTKKINRFRYQHKTSTGEFKDVEVHSNCYVYDKKELIFAIIHDVTETYKAKSELEKMARQWKATLDALPDILFEVDETGIIWDYRAPKPDLLYVLPNQFIEKKFADVLPRDVSSVIQNAITSYISGDDFRLYEYSLNIQGKKRWFEMSIASKGYDEDKKQHFIILVRDITEQQLARLELKQNEERFKKISAISTDYSYSLLVDKKGEMKLEWHFGAFEKITGYSPEEIWQDKGPDVLFFEDDLPLIKEKTLRKIKGEKVITEVPIYTKSGDKKWIRDIGVPEWDKKQKRVVRILGVAQDITKQKEAEIALKESENKLRELNATKDRFFSIIAHDLRNPFHALIGFSDLLLKNIKLGNYEKIDKYSVIIKNSTLKAAGLLYNLLEWSRSQTGTIDYEPEKINMLEVVDEAVGVLAGNIDNKLLKFYNNISPETIAFADKKMITTIIRNLISNAIKYTEKGGAIIVSERRKNNHLMISVKDTGVGIEKDNIKKLFNIGSNYSTFGTNQEKGTGLGLIICQEFIQKHGGRIWVESEPGKGSVFSFTIPDADGKNVSSPD